MLRSVMSVYVQGTSSKLLDMQARGSMGEADDRVSSNHRAVQCSETRVIAKLMMVQK